MVFDHFSSQFCIENFHNFCNWYINLEDFSEKFQIVKFFVDNNVKQVRNKNVYYPFKLFWLRALNCFTFISRNFQSSIVKVLPSPFSSVIFLRTAQHVWVWDFLQTPPPLQLLHSVLTDLALKIVIYHPQKYQILQFLRWIPHFWYCFIGCFLLTTVQELNISIIFQVC